MSGFSGPDQSSWTPYTPAVRSSAGSLASTSSTASATGRYKQIGKSILLQIEVTITTAGTATGSVFATLPFAARASRFAGSTYEYANSAKSGAAMIDPSATELYTRDAAAVSWWVNGNSLAITILYEIP